MIKISTSPNYLLKTLRTLLVVAVFSILILTGNRANAQVVYNENFDIASATWPNTDLPMGWSQGKYGPGVDVDNYWDRMNGTGGFPTIAAGALSPAGMMRYRSWSTTSGEASFLSTKRLDMTNIPAGGATGSFWVYRDNYNDDDRFVVYANTVADMTGTPVNIGANALFYRDCNRVVTGPCGAWYQVNFTVPQAGFNSASVYISILATSGLGNNIYIDNFTINTYPVSQQSFVNTSLVFQNAATTAPNNTNQQIIGVRVTTNGSGAVLPLTITNMLFNTNGSTNPITDISNAKLWFSGGTNSFSVGTATLLETFVNPHATNFNMLSTPFSQLENGDNYFWITYDISSGAFTGNYVDADYVSLQWRITKTYVSNYSTTSIVLNNTQFLTSGMSVTGTGVGTNATVSSVFQLSPGTDTVIVSVPHGGPLSGIITFTSAPIPPLVQTLAGRRLIDIIYCIPVYGVGTAWLNYNTNDYIASVLVPGSVAPGINNNQNTNGPPGCFPTPATCPFSAHPPDYEYFPPVSGKTAVFTQGVTYGGNRMQVGTYGSGNYLAMWIDFDRSSAFDPAERVYQSPTGLLANGWTPFFNINVPLGAQIGNTRLRVREVWISNNIQPCAYYTYGETEDYTVTILPACAPGWPGWKTWLGFTNDWDNPANWCGGVPTINDDARIPQPGAGPNDRPGNFPPMIKTGVFATARNLRIESNDSIIINATTSSSLTVDRDLTILDNTSWLIVQSAFADSARVSNGTLLSPSPAPDLSVPFRNTEKVKNIWLFTQAELLAEGLLANDVVSNILLHIKRYTTNPAPFKNVTIKMYYTDGTFPGFRFNGISPINFYTNMPPVIGPAPVTIFGPQDVNIPALIPIPLDEGTVDFNLIPGSFVWNGSSNKLVIEMSYDNQGFPVPNAPERNTFTQTGGFQHFVSLYGTRSNLTYPGETMVVPVSLPQNGGAFGSITGLAAMNQIRSTYPNATLAVGQWVEGANISFNRTLIPVVSGNPVITSAALTNVQVGHVVTGTGMLGGSTVIAVNPGVSITVNPAPTAGSGSTTLTFRPVITALSSANPPYLTITLSADRIGAPSGTINFGSTNSTPNVGTDYRPNLTFEFDRPYDRYPINIRQHWNNNGSFEAGKSIVTFTNSSLNVGQNIQGLNVTTFDQMRVNNPFHVTMLRDVIVNDTLFLSDGRLKLNNQLLTLPNSSIGAITVNNGRIQAETDLVANNISPFGRVHWKMGSAPGLRVLPFVKSTGVDVIMDYNIDSGTHDPIFATYGTTANNLNIPTPIVSNILGYNPGTGWGTDGYAVVDRYYMISHGVDSVAPQADIVFRYASSEDPQYGAAGLMSAQRWVIDPADPIDSSRWEFPYVLGQSNVAGSRVVTLNNFTNFNNNGTPTWWIIVGTATPLPVTLLDFKATPFKDKVRLDWVTASEINSSHFVVEKTLDNVDFSVVGQVESRGPSTNNLSYQTWDLNPVEGIQYYYLNQYDLDGRKETFGPVSAKFTYANFDIVTASVSSSEMGLTVVFSYDSDEPYSYKIIDMTGRVVVSVDRNPATPGMNVIDIDAKLAKGVYQVILQNSEKTVSRKFFY